MQRRRPIDFLVLETKSENLMNVVIESRIDFRLFCDDYDKKMLVMERKLMRLQIETGSKCIYNTTLTIPCAVEGDLDDLGLLSTEISTNQRRLDEMKQKLKDTQEIIAQLEAEVASEKVQARPNADTTSANATDKTV